MSKLDRYIEQLKQLEETKNYRNLPKSNIKGLVNLSTNDYLGLNDDLDLQKAFRETTDFDRLRFSAGSTRLLTGNIEEYRAVENRLAQLYDKEAALIFNSGYHTNMGVLPALVEKGDLIIADKEVHASLIDGMRLSQAEVRRYKHMDLDHLESILEKHRSNFDRVFIATESIFSMDGLRTDLSRLVGLKDRFDAFLYLDEAHAFGVIGNKGLGLAEESGLLSSVDFIVGTFGKSLASLGAFVVCNDIFRQFLVNKSRSLIYTTGLPPVNLAWTRFVLELLPGMSDRRTRVAKAWKYFSDQLGLRAESHVVPYVLGSNEKVIDFAAYMQKNGFYVLPIRYPTIPKGTERIRFSFNAQVTEDVLRPVFEIMKSYLKEGIEA